MSHTIVNVWKLLWPNGIQEADYETAFKVSRLVKNGHKQKRRRTRKFKPRLVSNDPNKLTPDQVAKTLSIKRGTVYAAIRSGKLVASSKGKSSRSGLLITKDNLEHFKKSIG